ncbi:MFS transporter [Sphaerisporangium fuscum]|uniref:MFS transporter n=1 Tax=Sphaerisporangium fuscum TaxID=2835868 RepID=UPI0027E37BFF|nr:MFS transporter [Sphaerisporangium fuscum]
MNDTATPPPGTGAASVRTPPGTATSPDDLTFALPASPGRPSAPVRRRRGGLLRDRDFRLLWIGETTSGFGSSLTAIALPLVAVTTLHAGPFVVAALVAVTWLPWLVVGLPAGAWVDRLPRRPVMLACDAVSFLLFVSVPAAAWWGVLTVGHLLVVALLAGTAKVFFQTAYQAYLPTVVAHGDLREGNAKLQGSESAVQVAGPGAGGLLAQAFGTVTGLLADAVTFLVSAVCLLAIRTREAPRPRVRRATTLRREIGEGLRFTARDPYLRVLTLFGAASNLALVGYQSILVVFLVREVGVSPGAVGLLSAATGLGGVAGAAGASFLARRFGSARALIACELLGAPFALLIPLATPGPGLAFVLVGGLVVVAGVVAGNVLKSSFRQAYTPRALMGRVSVSMQFLNYGTIPLGAVLAGALGDALGTRATMWIMTGALTLTGLILLAGPLRRERDLPAAPQR